MKKKLCLIFILLLSIKAAAQKEMDSTNINLWVPSAVVSLNISQLALSNWSQGGENTFAWTFVNNLGLKYLSEGWTYRNTLKFAYGRTKLGSQDFRTNDNEIYLESIVARNIGWAVDPFISFSVRTPFTRGFNYKKDPPQEIADFFDPGYVTESIGFTYDKFFGFKSRLGFAIQETFTHMHRQYSDDTSTTYKEAFKLETGLESVTTAEYVIFDNISMKSKLRFFTTYEHFDVWDVRWDNSIIAKVNSFINVNFAFLLIYERKQSVYTQIKEALQLGITYTII